MDSLETKVINIIKDCDLDADAIEAMIDFAKEVDDFLGLKSPALGRYIRTKMVKNAKGMQA